MKIEGNNVGGISPEAPVQKPGVAAGGSEAARRAARIGYDAPVEGTGGGAESGSQTDQVELSELGLELLRLAKSDPKREARIAQLASEYETGRFEPDSSATARKLVDDAFHNE